MMSGYYYSGFIFVALTAMAIHDTENYKKSGPRGLYLLFIALWLVGYVTGRGW